jgi:hypothetical protein
VYSIKEGAASDVAAMIVVPDGEEWDIRRRDDARAARERVAPWEAQREAQSLVNISNCRSNWSSQVDFPPQIKTREAERGRETVDYFERGSNEVYDDASELSASLLLRGSALCGGMTSYRRKIF